MRNILRKDTCKDISCIETDPLQYVCVHGYNVSLSCRIKVSAVYLQMQLENPDLTHTC